MKILVATDGSKASESVIEASCRIITHPENTEVKIISVVEPITPMMAEPFAISGTYYAEIEAASTQEAKTFVEQAAESLRETCPDLKDFSTEILHGRAAPTIVEAARSWSADLIVVGSHGFGFWSRALLGSVSNAVVHHAPCSVLIVREKDKAGI